MMFKNYQLSEKQITMQCVIGHVSADRQQNPWRESYFQQVDNNITHHMKLFDKNDKIPFFSLILEILHQHVKSPAIITH